MALQSVLVGRLEVLPGRETAFADWQYRHTAALSRQPGFVSCDLVPPVDASKSRVWTLAANFESESALQAWRESSEWRELVGDLNEITGADRFNESVTAVEPGESAGGMVTEVIFSRVRDGMEDAYRDWAARIQVALHSFAGYRGTFRQQPSGQKPGAPWITILRFDSIKHLEAWKASSVRTELIAESRAFVENEELRLTTSFPGWVPMDPVTGKGPPNWKTAMLVLIGLYPVVSLNVRFVSPLWEKLSLHDAFASLMGCVLGVMITSLVVMPFMVRNFKWWLFPTGKAGLKTALGSVLLLAVLAVEVGVIHWVLITF